MNSEIRKLLESVRSGETSVDDAMLELKKAPFEDIGYAKVDLHRKVRQGAAEVIYGAGKTPEQIGGIIDAMLANGQNRVLITRMSPEAAAYVGQSRELDYHKDARVGIVGGLPQPDGIGKVVIATGGTSDIPVAEEAALTAQVLGSEVVRLYDVGVSGVHRLLAHMDSIMEASVVVAIAGMEGALASVVGGLAECPVIAVPTSVGYGASFGGVAALLELLPDRAAFLAKMNGLGIPGVTVSGEKSVKCGVTGTHFSVKVAGIEEDENLHSHHHDHVHGSMEGIRQIVDSLPIPSMVKLDILAVYNLIAEAESRVHGVPVQQIHFHEVGAMDAVADITAVCLLMRELRPDQVIVSPVSVGSGTVRCAHGILPVPAPATALLLEGMPIQAGNVQGELCTPTGAALLKYFADDFGSLPVMRVQKTGYGMGKKDFPQANCLRVMLGETSEQTDTVAELKCNIDDMTGEEIGFAMEQLLSGGALDVFTTPIGMKKNRPGVLLSVLCRAGDRENMARLIFRHTTTLGIRESLQNRYTLERRTEILSTPYGTVRQKLSSGYGVQRQKDEYEDIASIAREQGLSIAQVREMLK